VQKAETPSPHQFRERNAHDIFVTQFCTFASDQKCRATPPMASSVVSGLFPPPMAFALTSRKLLWATALVSLGVAVRCPRGLHWKVTPRTHHPVCISVADFSRMSVLRVSGPGADSRGFHFSPASCFLTDNDVLSLGHTRPSYLLKASRDPNPLAFSSFQVTSLSLPANHPSSRALARLPSGVPHYLHRGLCWGVCSALQQTRDLALEI